MKLSARNILKGRIIRIVEGAVNCEVTLEVAPGLEIVAIITKTSVQSLGLAVGGGACAIIKASNVMLGIDD
ncbi:MAG TPA: molybdopterin-binding protein [Terrimicrobiaceae bacterium]|nr:molybdopterin-binding protein [Terrimicrobiaceae bacterium]